MSSSVEEAPVPSSTPKKKVMVTGANGYLASHMVQKLLEKGYTVHACVRDATDDSSVSHLRRLALSGDENANNRLKLFSTGDMGDRTLAGRYNGPLRGCCAVFHAATPLSPKLKGTADFDGERDILNPALEGTRELLDCIIENGHARALECLVLTSSMSAVAPIPEPATKDESHWSDDDAQYSRGNWYGCAKTRQERLVGQWSQSQKVAGRLKPEFRYCAICPTMILGSPLRDPSPIPSGTMGAFYKWVTGDRSQAPNDSMSFIDVQDCAAMHVAAMENSDAQGRYMSLVESLHWNELYMMLQKLYPEMPSVKLYDGSDLVTPTQFNLDKMRSLGVEVKSIQEIFEQSLGYFKSVGSLR